MPDDPRGLPSTDFRERLLLLRGRAGLSQRELATLTGASERAIQTWEAGVSYPSADRLKTLIALYLQRGVFAPGREQEEVVAFWETAREEAPRLNVPFDPAWFDGLRSNATAAVGLSAGATAQALTSRRAVLHPAPRWQDWGEAPDIGAFHGRAQELETLTRWVETEGCRLLTLLGMGGIG